MKKICCLTTADLKRAYEIECLSHKTPWSPETFATCQGKHYHNLKLTIGAQMIGYAITHRVSDEALLFNLAIEPRYQRQGNGHLLLSYLIEQLQGNSNIATLWLEVRASNKKAITLYENLGFNEISIRNNYYTDKDGCEDGVVMALSLEPHRNAT